MIDPAPSNFPFTPLALIEIFGVGVLSCFSKA
jgi:hypothetical protein